MKPAEKPLAQDLIKQLAQGPQGSPQNRPTVVTSKPANESGLGLGCLLRRLLWRQVCFRAPTPRTAFKYMAVMEEAIEHSGNGGAVAEASVVHRSIRCQQTAGALIAPHYDFQQVLGGGHG